MTVDLALFVLGQDGVKEHDQLQNASERRFDRTVEPDDAALPAGILPEQNIDLECSNRTDAIQLLLTVLIGGREFGVP